MTYYYRLKLNGMNRKVESNVLENMVSFSWKPST
jgi:hypothetical protein